MVVPLIKAMDATFYEGKMTGSFGIRFHYKDGILSKMRVQYPEQEVLVSEIDIDNSGNSRDRLGQK